MSTEEGEMCRSAGKTFPSQRLQTGRTLLHAVSVASDSVGVCKSAEGPLDNFCRPFPPALECDPRQESFHNGDTAVALESREMGASE